MNATAQRATAQETDQARTKVMATRIRMSAAALAAAGVLFVLYPAIRPFSDETSLQGAAAFGSTAWLVAHMMAMVGFTLLGIGLLGLYLVLQDTRAERHAFRALVIGMLGIGLTLPYYGGEAFGLHAVGQEALRQHSAALISLAPVIRGEPELLMFTVGLLLLAVSAVVAAIAVWKSLVLPKWSGVPLAVAFVLFIPQFLGSQPIRVAHGLLVTAGCVWLALVLWQQAGAIKQGRQG